MFITTDQIMAIWIVRFCVPNADGFSTLQGSNQFRMVSSGVVGLLELGLRPVVCELPQVKTSCPSWDVIWGPVWGPVWGFCLPPPKDETLSKSR